MAPKSASPSEEEGVSTATTAASSPPNDSDYAPLMGDDEVQHLRAEERAARAEVQREEAKRLRTKKKSSRKTYSELERKEQARDMEDLLAKSGVNI